MLKMLSQNIILKIPGYHQQINQISITLAGISGLATLASNNTVASNIISK